jgi:hypothetical protein
MAEWTMATVLKTVVGASSPGVRIPLPPLKMGHGETQILLSFVLHLQFKTDLLLGEMPEWSIGAAC